jgi:hypothetical protein
MKKLLGMLILSITIFACSQPVNNNQALQNRVDSLENKLASSYKPGLGEFMSDIQVHHAKLWFAGQNQNWKLADFEINELKESLANIQKYCADRPEVKAIGMTDQPLDSLSRSVEQKDLILFKNSFMLLTATCNNCHKATNHEFNVIKIPGTPPYSNQIFSVPGRPGETDTVISMKR